MGVEHERDFVAKLYSGPKWKRKVKKMTDAQVLAIYLKAKRQPKQEKKPKESTDDGIPF